MRPGQNHKLGASFYHGAVSWGAEQGCGDGKKEAICEESPDDGTRRPWECRQSNSVTKASRNKKKKKKKKGQSWGG